MVEVRAFRGLRFAPSRVADLGQVLAPPYDVIAPDEHRALLERSPYNIVRIELPTNGSNDPYVEAARTLEAWRQSGVLERDEQSSLYLYEERFEFAGQQRARRALVAALRLEPWSAGQVLPHERTMAGPKEDRLHLMRATRANVSPIWTLYRGDAPALGRAWDLAAGREPERSARLEDGTEHRLWPLTDPELNAAIEADFRPLKLYIADGHHRYETALHFRDELASQLLLEADHPANFVLVHLVAEDDPGLVLLATHRLVKNLGPLDQVELETELGSDWHGEYFPIWEGAPREQLEALLERLAAAGQSERVVGLFGPDTSLFGLLILRNQQLLEQRAPERSDAWRALDVALLDEGLLKPLLERAGAEREASVRYERDPYLALQAVLGGEYQLALFLNPTRPEQVGAIADVGDRMPEKSTYFYPKPPTGLVMRELG
jgi:uncharacterized protein (DUF1015 family)